MDDGVFPWDDIQAARNVTHHHVTFEMARLVFEDPFALHFADESEGYGEDRYVVIGVAEHRLLYVAYMMRGDAIRIISACLAEPFEGRRCRDDNEA